MESGEVQQENPLPVSDFVPGRLYAGVAKNEITTEEHDALIKDPLWVKALVLYDGTTYVAIITMDALAIGGIGDIDDNFLPQLRGRIERELDIPSCNVLVNASHTHPPGRILCDPGEQVSRTFDALRQALANMTAVQVGSGSGHEDGIMMNRNLKLKNGKHWAIRHANPCPPDEDVVDLEPADPEIGIIRIDRYDGQPLAVVYNFACHIHFGDPQGSVTANWPGIASKVIEDNWGSDVMALFLQGACGDIVDVHFKDFNRTRDVEPIGTTLALSTLKALREIKLQDATLTVISKTVEFPRRTDIPQRIAALRQEQSELLESLRTTSLNFKSFLPLYMKHMVSPDFPSDYSYSYLHAAKRGIDTLRAMDAFNQHNLDKYLSNIRAMEKLVQIQEDIATLELHLKFNQSSGEPTISGDVMGIKIGDCVIISAPLEVLTEVGLNIKKNSPYTHTFIAAFSNGYMHYGPPVSYYDKGGYEVTECFLAPQWQDAYEKAVSEIIYSL